MADDVPIPPEALAWVESECITYFETGGRELPNIAVGFEGAEIHAHYEINQKRMEHQGMDDMLDALSSALFKTTGDKQFEVEKKTEVEEPNYGTMERKPYQPDLKYKIAQIGEFGSGAMNQDDTTP